jgi:MFS family permease
VNLAILFLSLFVGFAAPFCGQLNLLQQAALYHKTTVQITYFNSAASAGLATGGFIWWPLSHKFGRTSVIFWSLFGQLGCQIWAPLMTGPDDYVPYLVSRYFSGFFGIVVSVLGPRYLVDMYFLHQRGRAFTSLHLALNFGASFGPTVSGFVAGRSYWPVEYWWSVALCGFTIIAVFLFLEETSYDRTPGAVNRVKPASWLKDRYETFFFGSKVGAGVSWGDMVSCSASSSALRLVSFG